MSIEKDLKIGDYVEFYPGDDIPGIDKSAQWVGQVVKFHPDMDPEEGVIVELILDSQSIRNIPVEYLEECGEMGTPAHMFFIAEKYLKKSTPRDHRLDFLNAYNMLQDKLWSLGPDYENLFDDDEEIIDDFIDSIFFDDFEDEDKEHVEYIVRNFTNLIIDIEGIALEQIDTDLVKRVCLEHVPAHIVAPEEVFELYGTVLPVYFHFLSTIGVISDQDRDEINNTIEEIKDLIPSLAKDPNNWGPGKQLIHTAEQAGVDIQNQEELGEFLNYAQELEEEELRNNNMVFDPFKSIGRNQKISVKYQDGSQKVGVKFKKVEKDLRMGKCFIIDVEENEN